MNSVEIVEEEKIMSLDDKVKAAAKNVEGKAQEALGNVTGDPEDKAEGKAKQAEANARNAVEDGKDAVKKAID
jgi:uncharacterized protein YjbJ (UPF0337 family)